MDSAQRTQPSGRVNIRACMPQHLPSRAAQKTLSITDQYSGLLDDVSDRQRRGLIAMLSTGYYDGWRPLGAELIRYLQDNTESARRPHLGIAEQMPEHR